MPYQNIDVVLAANSVQAVKDAFAQVLTNLPFLVNLTPEERKATVKTGPDSVSFVNNALTAAQDYPDIFPASFDRAAFQSDVALFGVMTELVTQAESVFSQMDDTRVALGGEAMRQAMQVYEYVKTAAKTRPGLKPIAEQLAARFKKTGGGDPNPPPNP